MSIKFHYWIYFTNAHQLLLTPPIHISMNYWALVQDRVGWVPAELLWRQMLVAPGVLRWLWLTRHKSSMSWGSTWWAQDSIQHRGCLIGAFGPAVHSWADGLLGFALGTTSSTHGPASGSNLDRFGAHSGKTVGLDGVMWIGWFLRVEGREIKTHPMRCSVALYICSCVCCT